MRGGDPFLNLIDVNNFDAMRIGLASPKQIQVNITNAPLGNPFGSFDTPIDNTAGVAGAIPVTGWALDAVEVVKVDIWREPVGSEPAGALIFIGDAVFVEGARPGPEFGCAR